MAQLTTTPPKTPTKALRPLLELLAKDGWRFQRRSARILCFAPPPSSFILTLPLTPSDSQRWLPNNIARIRRGYGEIPGLDRL